MTIFTKMRIILDGMDKPCKTLTIFDFDKKDNINTLEQLMIIKAKNNEDTADLERLILKSKNANPPFVEIDTEYLKKRMFLLLTAELIQELNTIINSKSHI